jgi:conjugal transfer mating pair stabilization protein TraN
MKKLFLIILITQQFVFGLTNEELLKPSNNAIDFTFSSLDASPDTFSPEQTVSRVEMDVEKILGFIPRHFKTNTCGTDTYGNNYCNEALSECSQEWDYENGYSVSGVGQVVDYASKLTSTNYQNAGTRNILANLNLAGTVLCDSRYHFWGEGNRWYSSYYNGNPSKGDSSYLTFNFDKNYNMVRINGRMFQDSIFDTWTNNTNIVVFHNNGSPRGSITFNVINGNYSITGEARTERTTIKTDGSNCLYFDDCHGRGIQKLCFEPVYQTENYCPQGWVYNGYVEQGCSQNILICPSGYTETTGTETANGQCKKDISYTFYEYKCSDAQNSQDYNYIPHRRRL